MLAPSERYHQLHHQRHKKLIDWARQMLTQLRQWLPEHAIVLVADSSFAALELLEALRQLPNPVYAVTQLRLDALMHERWFVNGFGRLDFSHGLLQPPIW